MSHGGRRLSLLHLQMGQEVIYLLMTSSLIAAMILLVYVIVLRNDVTELDDQLSRAPSIENFERLVRENEEFRNVLSSSDKLDKPPIITLTEADGYFFHSGSAEISEKFRRNLRENVIPKLVEYGLQYRVDVIEVIGHTDEVPVGWKSSNLDDALLPFLHSPGSVEVLQASDNAGLGMARAAAVVSVLLADGRRLARFKILPLSAAQATDIGDLLASGANSGDVLERRRIEIRMRRSH